jgi:hypothetical protein
MLQDSSKGKIVSGNLEGWYSGMYQYANVKAVGKHQALI